MNFTDESTAPLGTRVMVQTASGNMLFGKKVYRWGSNTETHWIDDQALLIKGVTGWTHVVSKSEIE